MSSLRQRLAIIPGAAWVVAVLGYIAFVTFMFLGPFRHEPGMFAWAKIGLFAFILLMPLVIPIWLLLVGFVYADAKRRHMRYVMWTLLAFWIPNGIGVILYFLMREPLPAPCPRCGAVGRPGFSFCPSCGGSLKPACPSCGKPTEAGWSHCANCGAGLSGSPGGTRQAPVGV